MQARKILSNYLVIPNFVKHYIWSSENMYRGLDFFSIVCYPKVRSSKHTSLHAAVSKWSRRNWLENEWPLRNGLSEKLWFLKAFGVSSRGKTFVVLSISSLLFPRRFLRADVAKNTRSGIEVVITGLTRNQFGSNPTRVRIPPAAPKRSVYKRVCAVCRLFFFAWPSSIWPPVLSWNGVVLS